MSGNQGSGDGWRNGDSVWTSGDGTMHTSTPKPINLQDEVQGNKTASPADAKTETPSVDDVYYLSSGMTL